MASTAEDDPSGSVVYKLQRLTSNGPTSRGASLSNLSNLLDFINEKLFPHLPPVQRTGFPRSLVKPLTTSIMTNLLVPSLPSTLEALPEYLELTRKTVEFESRYIAGLLGGDSADSEIKAWADNVCVHYEKARRIYILDAFRDVVLERATLKGQTFMAEVVASPPASSVHGRAPVLQEDSIAKISPTSETDAWNLDDQSFATSSSKSAVDDSSWGFDDDIDQSGQIEGDLITPEAEAEVDPGDAWGWNDDDPSEQPEADPADEPAAEPSEEEGTWDNDPWTDSTDVHKSTVPINLPIRPVPPTGVPTKSQKVNPEQRETNGHANHGSSKPSWGSDHVTKETYLVSTLMTDIVQTVEKCLQEGKSLACSGVFFTPSTSTSSPGTLIMHSGALVIDLYCALYPVATAARLSKPVQHMQYSNDCYYLSEELSRVLLHTEEFSDVKGKLEERRDDLNVLTDSWFHEGVVSFRFLVEYTFY